MFFNNIDFSIKISSVLTLGSEPHTASSDDRPYHALSFRLSGSARIESDDVAVNVGAHDILIVPAGKMYTVSSEEREELIVVHFFSDTFPVSKITSFAPSDSEYFESLFKDLIAAWNKRTRAGELECIAIFYKILSYVEHDAEVGSSDSNDKISEAEKYIREHFTQHDLNIDELAKRSGMSDTYFRQLFSERYGITPLKYINKLRLDYARELLESRYYTVTEVSQMCGFNNINYFSTFIKKELGISPKKI